MNLLNRWHNMLNMPKYDENWHRQDLADELAEYSEAKGFVDIWSELSDVAYTYTRANWSGHKNITFPLSRAKLYIGILYMLPKYTLRWRFFRKLGHYFDINLHISEVRNPRKVAKLKVIAEKYNLDPEQFQIKAEQELRRSILLK
ncbi:MAG: hypothetical protein KBC78_02230 [Candidatus Pacebacteria bacterium]|nr:hypothetical protein [Candidatus Paceibacterota bacterium]